MPADPAITPELIAKHGLTPDEFRADPDDPRAEPNFTELGDLLSHVERALLL
jgi:phosphoribosylformylglycinamidine synthase